MSHYRIRREGMEFPVAGLEALVRLVQEGALGPTDRVFDPTSDHWVPAGDMGLLKGAFADRAREQAARRNRSKRPPPSLLPSAGLGPVAPAPPEQPPARSGSLFEIPPDLEAHSKEHSTPNQQAVFSGGNLRGGEDELGAGEGRDTDPGLGAPRAPKRDPGPDHESGRVVPFDDDPHRAQLGTLPPFGASLNPDQASAALDNPAAFLRSADRPPADQPKPAARPALLLMTVVVGLLGAFLFVSYFQQSASMYAARRTSVTGGGDGTAVAPDQQEDGFTQDSPGEPAPTTAGGRSPRSSDHLYEEMELALRNRMVPGCSTIAREDDLDTALRVELSRLGVHAHKVHAPVLTWGGRKGDMPHAVEIMIWYQGQAGELDRELGAIGLVVGKYAQQYGLDVRSFEVYLEGADGTSRLRALDANQAKQLYLRRVSLLQFLTGDAG
jgi:hypothetical protein